MYAVIFALLFLTQPRRYAGARANTPTGDGKGCRLTTREPDESDNGKKGFVPGGSSSAFRERPSPPFPARPDDDICVRAAEGVSGPHGFRVGRSATDVCCCCREGNLCVIFLGVASVALF